MKSESEFVRELEKKAEEQRRLLKTELLPDWAKGVGAWLVVNPWRVLVPVAGSVYLLLRITLGAQFRELILAIFGGYR